MIFRPTSFAAADLGGERRLPSNEADFDSSQNADSMANQEFVLRYSARVGAHANICSRVRQEACLRMVFVPVQHLAPSHPIALTEKLARATKMPVMEVRDEPTVEPWCAIE